MVLAAGLIAAQESLNVARLVRIPIRANFAEHGEVVREYNGIKPGFEFDEVIPSWNFDHSHNGAIRIELRISTEAGRSPWYVMADWSGDSSWSPRQSTEKQNDELAKVSTDTLVVKKPTDRVDLRVTLKSRGAAPAPFLKLLTLCFSDTRTTKVNSQWSTSKYRGGLVDVPQRAQGLYPNGGVLCSATCTSMLLWHYNKKLGKNPDVDVPEVESNVWDPIYKGAGNWPFNTAYFGSFSGYKGAVSRLTGIQDLERLTKAGIPVACSVNLDLLKGKPTPRDSGHLILVVGFDNDGTPIVNDPAFKDGVRKTYNRTDFERSWCESHRTVYLMIPDSVKIPGDVHRVWGIRAK